MSEQTAPTQTETVTQPTTDAKPAPQAPPGLNEALVEYQGQRARAMGTKPPEPAPAKPADEAKVEPPKADKPEGEKPAEEAAKEPDKKDAKKPEAVKEEAGKPKEEPPKPAADEMAESMVRVLRQSRALARKEAEAKAAREAEVKAMEKERADHAAAIAAAQRFDETRKKDPVLAVEELLGDEVMQGSFAFDLINHLAEKAGDVPLPPERIADIAAIKAEATIRAKMAEEEAARQAAEVKAKEEKARAEAEEEERMKTAYFVGLAEQLKADAEKYPYLIAEPVDWDEVDEFIRAEYAKTRRAPSPEQIFKHFDGKRERTAASLAAVYNQRNKPPQEKPPEASSKGATRAVATGGAAVDTKGRSEIPAKETQREKLERVARELDAQFGR